MRKRFNTTAYRITFSEHVPYHSFNILIIACRGRHHDHARCIGKILACTSKPYDSFLTRIDQSITNLTQ